VGGRSYAPDPTGGAYSTQSDSPAQLRALLLKGRDSRRGKVEGERREKGGEARGTWGGGK